MLIQSFIVFFLVNLAYSFQCWRWTFWDSDKTIHKVDCPHRSCMSMWVKHNSELIPMSLGCSDVPEAKPRTCLQQMNSWHCFCETELCNNFTKYEGKKFSKTKKIKHSNRPKKLSNKNGNDRKRRYRKYFFF